MYLQLLTLAVLVAAQSVSCQEDPHPLDVYVRTPDDSYEYSVLGSFRDEDRLVTCHQLNMTSQTWQDDSVSTATVWFHYMAVCVPDDLKPYSQYTTLFISEGHQDDGPIAPGTGDLYLPLVMDMASQSGLITTLLNQIPNQPILFHDDPKQKSRSEDDIIAFTMRKFHDDGHVDPTILALFPMTKAAVRAMDTVQDFTANNLGITTEQFCIAGGSKRGWTTYLSSATDPQGRVFATVPIVFSLINFLENLMLHYRSLGGWSWAMSPYYEEGLSAGLVGEVAEEYKYLMDPYDFKDRMTWPKMIIAGTGDEFFFPHESGQFFHDLPGQNYFFMLENTNHVLLGQHARIVRNLVSFVTAIIEEVPLPVLTWEESLSEDNSTGKISMTSDITPYNVTRWTATTTSLTKDRRDYRLLVKSNVGPGLLPNPIVWFDAEVEANADGVYEVEYEVPDTGYRGFFMTAEYEMADGHFFEATTEVRNLPESFPYEECTGSEECTGELV